MSIDNSIRNRVLAAAAFVFLIHVLGIVFPEQMWGSHFLSYLPGWLMLGILGFVGIGIAGCWFSTDDGLPGYITDGQFVWHRVRLIIPLLAGAFANLTPIVRDVYGDSYYIAQELEVLVKEWTPEMTTGAFSFNPLDPKEGIRTFYSITNFIGYVFETQSATVIRYFQVVLAMVFIVLWLNLVTRSCSNLTSRLALGIMGLLVPVGLLFHQHFETYALPFTLFMGFIVLLKTFYQKQSSGYLVALFFYLLIGLKFHISFFLLLPALILASLHYLSMQVAALKSLLKPKSILLFMILPGLVLVGAVYILHGSVNGTRLAPPDNLYDALFVPLIPLEMAPYSRYSLLSWAHLLDYFQVLFSWSPIGWFILVVTVLTGKIRNALSAFNLNLMVLFVAMIGWFFVLNPLLGMAADWDLFSFPAIILMAMTAQFFSSMENEKWARKLAVTAVFLCLLNVPVFIVNASTTMLSQRYETLFLNDFKHFWIGSSTFFEVATEMEENPQLRLQRQLDMINELAPYATDGNDVEYAEILRQTAINYGNLGDLSSALHYHRTAEQYAPNLKKNVFDLIVVYFKLNRPAEALPYLDRHIANGYPTRRKATLMAIHVSIAAADYDRARYYCSSFLKNAPKDAFMLRVFNALSSNTPGNAIQLFAGS